LKTLKIVLVAGPCTGKTTTIKALRKKGHCCFDEVSRKVTLAFQKQGIDQLFLKKPLLFSEKLLDGRIHQFKAADRAPEELCFLDRGIPEVGAYMDYKDGNIPEKFKKANADFTYDRVFLFPMWKEIYQSDNERYETFQEAQKIQPFIIKAYENLGYHLIEVPRMAVTERVKFILEKCHPQQKTY